MFESLSRRPRGRKPAALLYGLSGGQLGAPPPAAPAPDPAPYPIDLTERSVEPEAAAPGEIADIFVDRLTSEQLEQLDALMQDHPPELWRDADDHARRGVAVQFALWFGIPGVEESTGLSAALPPEHIHQMASGPLAAGGAILQAEQLCDVLTAVGARPGAGDAVLDFGCSSGRVVRVLGAALPEARWLGCDPNADAVAWANEHLPVAEFFTSPLEPPLPELADGELAAAYGVSIWSHFDEGPALRWIEEMRRVIRPGGHLIVTTHGIHSIAHYARRNGEADQRAIFEALYRDGFLYFDVFDEEEGDWGVKSTGWGMAFMTPEWLQARVTPDWSVALYRPGAIEGNQDLYVLRRER